jgi:hypothetical protein
MEESRYNSLAACLRFEAELEAYLDGEARPFIGSHALICSTCGALLADLQAIRHVAQELPLEEPSPMVWASLRAKLEAEGAFATAACSQFNDELAAYLEGEARPFVMAHSQACVPCGALLADLQAIQHVAQELPLEEPSPLAWTNLRAKLEAEGAFATAACSQFNDELAAYLEGEARPFVMAHSQACKPCATLLADLQAIRQAARELPLEEPSRVVWANIRARLEDEGAFGTPVSGWRQILAWRFLPHAVPLGVLAALVFIGSVLTLPPSGIQGWGSSDTVAGSPATAQLALLPSGEDSALARVVSNLETSFRASESSMAPDLKATYDKSLITLDGSIHECLDSLRHEPGNTLAHDYLLTAYTRKAEILSSALEFEGR